MCEKTSQHRQPKISFYLPCDNSCTSWMTFSRALLSPNDAFSPDAALRNMLKSSEAFFSDVDVWVLNHLVKSGNLSSWHVTSLPADNHVRIAAMF